MIRRHGKGLRRRRWHELREKRRRGIVLLPSFNVQTGTVDRRFFIGLSTPAAAGVVAASILLLGDGQPPRWAQIALAAAAGVLALMMVSTFRYWSFKEVDFVRRRPLQTLL